MRSISSDGLDLNTPHRTHQALRPVAVIDALSQPDPKGNRSRSRLFSSREHQDAQELFQLLSTCVQEEAADVNHESMRDVGLAEFDKPSPADSALKETTKNVFEGLTANRRSCVQCGYTEAVMHFSFDNLTLPVPRAVGSISSMPLFSTDSVLMNSPAVGWRTVLRLIPILRFLTTASVVNALWWPL